MAKEKEDTTYAETTPAGAPAYPQWIHFPTDKKYANGEPVCESVLVKNSDEHKKLIQERSGKQPEGWGKKDKE